MSDLVNKKVYVDLFQVKDLIRQMSVEYATSEIPEFASDLIMEMEVLPYTVVGTQINDPELEDFDVIKYLKEEYSKVKDIEENKDKIDECCKENKIKRINKCKGRMRAYKREIDSDFRQILAILDKEEEEEDEKRIET